MKQFTKSDLVNLVVRRTGEKRALASKMVNEIFTVMRNIMSDSSTEVKIVIRDFGVFEVYRVKPRIKRKTAVEPSQEPAPAKMKTVFKPGKYLKKSLRKEDDQ